MIIAVGRLVALVVSTVIVVAVSAVVWPLDSALHKLASSGAKLCFAYDETLLVGAKLEGDEFDDAHVIAAASIPSMQRLSLNGSKVTLQGLQSLQSLPKLVSLSLNDTHLSVEAFTILCGLPVLRELELDRCHWVADEHLELLAGMKKLEFVSLAENSISAAGIDRLRQIPSLRFVRLDRCRQIDDSAIDAIVQLCAGSAVNVGLSGTDVTQQGLLRLHARIPGGRIHMHPDTLLGLREIAPRGRFFLGRSGEVTSFRRRGDLDGSVVPLLPGDLKVVGKNREIREILLEDSNLDDAMLRELPDLPNLETLRLTGTRITDQGLKALSHFPNLTSLCLLETNLDGLGLSHLAELPRLTNLKIQARHGDEILDHLESLHELQMLTLAAPLTDLGMERLAALPRLKFLALVGMGIRKSGIARLSKCSSLTELRFDGGAVDDSDVETIAALVNVKRVMLSQTQVSQKGRDRLVALRPDMVVHWPREMMSGHSAGGR